MVITNIIQARSAHSLCSKIVDSQLNCTLLASWAEKPAKIMRRLVFGRDSSTNTVAVFPILFSRTWIRGPSSKKGPKLWWMIVISRRGTLIRLKCFLIPDGNPEQPSSNRLQLPNDIVFAIKFLTWLLEHCELVHGVDDNKCSGGPGKPSGKTYT